MPAAPLAEPFATLADPELPAQLASAAQNGRRNGHHAPGPPTRTAALPGGGSKEALVVGAPGFEPGTSPTRTVRATRLRHAPMTVQYSTRTARAARWYVARAARCPPATADIIAFLDELLDDRRASQDLGPNGLQVPGAAEVTTVVTGVSAQRELFERAVDEQAQLVLAHHGILWDFEPRRIGHARRPRASDCCSPTTSRSPATTCRSTRIREHRQQRAARRGLGASSHVRAFPVKGEPIGVDRPLRRRRRPGAPSCSRASPRSRERDAARLRRRPRAHPHARDRLRRRRRLARTRRSTSGSTPSSPASRRST